MTSAGKGEHMEMRKRSISMASENRTNTVEDIIALPEGQRAELLFPEWSDSKSVQRLCSD